MPLERLLLAQSAHDLVFHVRVVLNADSAHLENIFDGLHILLFRKKFLVILHDLFVLLLHFLHALEVSGLRLSVLGLPLVLLELNLLLFQVSDREGPGSLRLCWLPSLRRR